MKWMKKRKVTIRNWLIEKEIIDFSLHVAWLVATNGVSWATPVTMLEWFFSDFTLLSCSPLFPTNLELICSYLHGYWKRFEVSWAITGIWGTSFQILNNNLFFRRRQDRFSVYRKLAFVLTRGRMRSLLHPPIQWWRAVGAVVLSVLKFTLRRMLRPMLERYRGCLNGGTVAEALAVSCVPLMWIYSTAQTDKGALVSAWEQTCAVAPQERASSDCEPVSNSVLLGSRSRQPSLPLAHIVSLLTPWNSG